MKIEQLHRLFLQYPTICTDTRKISPNSLFFALKGVNFDANDFAQQAIENGCRYAIVDKKSLAGDECYILVDDVLETLQQLANYHRNFCKAKIIGITGTNGKTTTKELINAVLSTSYQTIATKGNLNNHIGVPLTLLQIEKDTEFAVIEMGANHMGEIEQLCKIVEPQFGIITNIGTGHIEGFGSKEGILQTKLALYKSVAKKQGVLFVNANDALLMKNASELHTKIYKYAAGIEGKVVRKSLLLEAEIEGKYLKTNLIGAYNLDNILAAYALGKYFGVDKGKSLQALAAYCPKNNRSQLVETGKNTLILDAYNANPSSMEKAILNFSKLDLPSKTLILGDMLELGSLSEQSHTEIKELLEKLDLDGQTFLVGKHFSKSKIGQFSYFETSETLMEFLERNPLEKRQILIKGSRGIHLEDLVEQL